MPRPTQRVGTKSLQFRQRIPYDVRDAVRGRRLAIPLGETIHTVTVSAKAEVIEFPLRTSDPARAKMLQAAVVSYLERTWAEIRRGSAKLSHKQIVALAGELYADFVKAFEDDPGPPKRWADILVENALAAAAKTGTGSLMIRFDEASEHFARHASLRDRFGGFMEALLARRSLVVDEASRTALLEQVARVMDEAALRLMANAEGDYRPDPNAERFPAWVQTTPRETVPAQLVRERGVSVAQAARNLDVHENQLRKWVREFTTDPAQAFPGQGQMKPEQLEIERLRREVAKERDILKKSRGLLREGVDMKFGFISKHRAIWPITWLCEALGVSRSGFHAWLTRSPSRRARSEQEWILGMNRDNPGEGHETQRIFRSQLRQS